MSSASALSRFPATGHPSRYFEETAIPVAAASSSFVDPRNIAPPIVSPTRVERAVPLKALVSQINYNLFDMELGKQQSQFAYLQAKDLADTVDGVLRTHDIALWNGTDTSLSSPTTAQYMGAVTQIAQGGNSVTIGVVAVDCRWPEEHHRADAFEHQLRRSPHGDLREPGAARPHRPRDEERVQRGAGVTSEITSGFTVKMLSTQAGNIPLIPEWTLPYTGTPGSGSAVLPAYIVTEDLIEYHWLSDPSIRASSSSDVPGSLASQYVVVKFGGVVVKGANYAHYQVLVDR